MEQNSLHNTRDNALRDAQTQIRRNFINSQGDGENSPIPRIHNGSHTADITDQVIAHRKPEPINYTKPESLKETIKMEQNTLDNTRDNILRKDISVCKDDENFSKPAIHNSSPEIQEPINQSKMSFVDGRKDADMSFVDGRKDADMSFVDGRKDADMLVSELVKIMSFVDGRKDADMDIFELEKNMSFVDQRQDADMFSREREEKIVKKNNNKNLEREILKETTKTWQKILDNTCDNERNNAQTQIEEDIYDYQIDGKNYRHPEIYDCAQTSSEHKQINPIKLERPKEAITTEQNSLDNTSDNERNNIEGDIINQEQPEITDPVNAYQNPEPMSQSILSLLQRKYLELKSSVPEKDILELERFSREREKEIVKRNNNKNLERSFVDVRKDADMWLVDVRKDADMSFVDGLKDAAMSFVDGLKDAAMLQNDKSKQATFIDVLGLLIEEGPKQIHSIFSKRSLLEKKFLGQKRQFSELRKKLSLLEKKILGQKRQFSELRKKLSLQERKILKQERYNRDAVDAPVMYNRDAMDAPVMYNRDAVDAPVMYNRDAVDAPKMFGNPGAFVVIKLSKFSKTYELKAQLKAFVKNAVRTSKPVTIEMLRTAASLAGIEIEELFLRNSNSQPITSEDLTYVIYFPEDC